jgi:hypothetical protein
MKKLILICLAMMTLSCKTFFYGKEPTFTMGMSENEFKQKNKPEMVLATEDGRRIFRTYNPFTKYKFFFFKDEKLVRFENGEYPDEYKYNWL